MKKYLFAVLFLAMAWPVLANDTIYPDPEGLTKSLQQAAQKAVSSQSKPASFGAHEKGVVKIVLDVEAKFDEEYARTNYLRKKCAAVRIAPGYLLASLACRGVAETAIQYKDRGDLDKVEVPVDYRKTTAVSIGKYKTKDIIEDETSKLLLIKVEDDKIASLKNAPITNLFVAQDPNSFNDLFDEVIVNREKSGWFGRTCSTVDITHVCADTRCFSVCWKMIDADNGDPVFGLSDKKENQEFLLGFNDAEPDGQNRTSGRLYRFFSQASLNFLHKNIDKAAWQKLQKKTVDETFFK